MGEPRPKPMPESGPDVARGIEFGPDPGGFERAAVIGRGIAGEPLEHGFGRNHARFHRRVAALDLGHVEETGGVADDQAAGERQGWDRLKPALVQGARTIGDALASLEHAANGAMRFETLELLERREIGIGVVEPDYETSGEQILVEVIEKRATIGAAIERPADGVHGQTGAVLGGIDLPQLLDAEAVALRVAVAAQAEARLEQLGQGTAAALGEQRLRRAQFGAGLEIRPPFPARA